MTLYYEDDSVRLYHGDALAELCKMPDRSVDCCVTSPPYFGLRDYGVDGQLGLEASPAEYVAAMVAVFAEVRRVLADDGTLWLNLGDSYASHPTGHKPDDGALHTRGGRTIASYQPGTGQTPYGIPSKNLLGIPWRVAFALQDDGWTLRNDIIWHKPNAMPESIQDRLSNRYEHVFLLAKSRRYFFDLDPIRETRSEATMKRYETPFSSSGPYGTRKPGARERGVQTYDTDNLNPAGKNPGDVWSIPTAPFAEAHFAAFPPALAERCVLAGCKPGGTVLDPFSGAGTTGYAATKHGRRYVGIDLSSDYLDMSLRTRLAQGVLDFDSGGDAA